MACWSFRMPYLFMKSCSYLRLVDTLVKVVPFKLVHRKPVITTAVVVYHNFIVGISWNVILLGYANLRKLFMC